VSIPERAIVMPATRPASPPPPGMTAVNTTVLNDRTLSLEARGLFCTISSFPGGVTVHELRGFVRPGVDRRDMAVRLLELLTAGVVVAVTE
jgi:hypothetical protein